MTEYAEVYLIGITTFGGRSVRDGLYKVVFHTVHSTGSGVIYASGGKLRWGNSAFAFLGNYNSTGETISARVSTQRHNDNPSFRPLFAGGSRSP